MISKSKINLIPLEKGIYFLFNEAKEIVYIGISKNIRKRIKTHIQTKRIKFKFIRYSLIEKDMKEIWAIEKRFTDKIKPLFNRTSSYYDYRQAPEALISLFNLEKRKIDYEKKVEYLKKRENDILRELMKDDGE